MVRPENAEAKLAALRRHLDLLKTFRGKNLGDVRADPYLRGALERYLFLSVQSAIDLAEMICALKELPRPESMARGFAALENSGVLPHELSESLQRMVGFRNALVHGYENLDYSIVEDVLKTRLNDLDDFATRVEGVLAG